MGQVKDTISKVATSAEPPDAPARGIPLQVVSVPADGMCAWRSIWASKDLESFCLIPRTGLGSILSA